MTIYDKVLAYLKEHNFSQVLTYEQFTILPSDRRRGLFVHIMPGREHFCVCQLAQVVQSGDKSVGSEVFAFLSVRDGKIDPLELRHEAGLRALGAELVEYEATLAVQPSSVEDEEENIAPEDIEDDGESDDDEDGESGETVDWDDWSHNLSFAHESWPVRIADVEKLPYLNSLNQLQGHPLFRTELLDAVAVHVSTCVPEGFDSHGRVWALSSMNKLTKGFEDVSLLGVHINGYSFLNIVATASGSGEPPLLILLTVMDGRMDEVDAAELEKVQGFKFLKSSPEGEDLGFGCIGLPSLDALALALKIPGVIWAARLAAIRMNEQKTSKKRPQPSSNLAVLDLIASRSRPSVLDGKYLDAASDYLGDAELDSAWLPDGEYPEFLSALAASAAQGDQAALDRLLRESNRTFYRASWSRRLSVILTSDAIRDQAPDSSATYAIATKLLKTKMPDLLARAVLFCCHLAPPVEGKSFETPLSFLRTINGRIELLAQHHDVDVDMDRSHNLEGAVFAGVLFTADIQITPMLESAWTRLSRQAQIAAFELRPNAVSFAYLDFVLARLREVADTDDSLCGEIILHLRALPNLATIPAIDDRLFWFNDPEKEFLYAENVGEDAREEMCYAEYVRENRELFDEIAMIENKPRMMPDLIKEWRQFSRADLERRKAEAESES